MMDTTTPMSNELRAAINVQAQRIPVDSYYTMAMNKGLKGHAMGFWSGTLMGLATGSAAGIILHLVAGAALTASGLAGWPIVLGLASVGAGVGGTVGSRVGSAAGAVSGVMMEFERRQKARELEAEVMASPEKQAEVLAHYRQNPVVEKDDTVSEIFTTSSSNAAAWGKIILPTTMILTTLICAAAGAIMGAGAFMLGGATAIGPVASAGVAAMIGAGLGITTGISFGIYYPAIFAQLGQTTGDLLSGQTAEALLNGKSIEPTITQYKANAPLIAPIFSDHSPTVTIPATRPSARVDAAYAQQEGTAIQRTVHPVLQ